MTLAENERRWGEYLRSEQCPPVLGLAPLEELERSAIRDTVTAQLAAGSAAEKFDELLGLIELFPASLATWLSREAGEAYNEGEFWPRFEQLIGVPVPPLRRSELARDFRYACGSTMRNFTAPLEKGAFIYVETFLHQAGLPVCQVAHFARFVRQVERSSGLPAPDDASCGTDLAERLLEVVHPSLVTLRRALRGAAGPLTCEVALRLIFAGDYAGVNPHLREELARQFASAPPGSIRRSPRAPFLRLAADLCALELVGPRQDGSVIGRGGLRWVVNGHRHPVASFDEFVHPLGDEESVNVELQGLSDGHALSRVFALRLDGRRPPCMLFDAAMRLPPRVTGEGPVAVRAGSYWMLHRAADDSPDASERIAWADGARALSLITIRPGATTTLRDERGSAVCEITAEAAPCFILPGKRLISDDSEVLHYGWEELPIVWLPEPAPGDWTLRVVIGDKTTEVALTPEPTTTEGTLTACDPPQENPLGLLQPGLYEVTLTLSRRGRQQLTQTFLVWKGLKSVNSEHFVTDAWPENLVPAECLGFSLATPELRHTKDKHRAHRLAFRVNGEVRTLRWCRPGTFLESFIRKPGASIQPRGEALGTTFSAGTDSTQWLRVWRTGKDFAEIRVNGSVFQAFGGEGGRPFFDVSLANLALLYPQGGALTLLHRGLESSLARFARPLSVTVATNTTTSEARGLNISVADPIELARVRFDELLSGRTLQTEQLAVILDDKLALQAEDLPAVILGCALDTSGTHLTWTVPRAGWPEGVWVCELELRRAQDAEWQPLCTTSGERLPLRAEGEPITPPEGFRARAIWSNISPHVQVGRLVEDGAEMDPVHALDLLSELLQWRQIRYHTAVAKYFEWVDALCSWLCRRMSGVIHREDEGPALRLLHLASGRAGRRFFVDVPGLLALPASLYRQLTGDAPLIQSLALCGQLAASETVLGSVTSGQVEVDFATLAGFANFGELATRSVDIGVGDEFHDFNFGNFWSQTLGAIHADRRDAEWVSQMPALSRMHARWAVEQLGAAYETVANDPGMGIVNGLLQTAPAFRSWLKNNIGGLPAEGWNSPWLEVNAGSSLVPAATKFASLLSLAARASAAKRFDFSSALAWLDDQAQDSDRTRKALSALVELAPEVIGFYLIFWELIFRTHPQND